MYQSPPALYSADTRPEGFEWIDANDAGGNVLSFVRNGADGSKLVCVANFAGTPHLNYKVGMPAPGTWREVINTDAGTYGGSGVGNMGEVVAKDEAWHGRPASAVLQLPPAGVLWLALDQ